MSEHNVDCDWEQKLIELKAKLKDMNTHIELIDAILVTNDIAIEGNELDGLQRAFTQLKRDFDALLE